MVITETSFPRGGIVRDKPKEPTIHFGATTLQKPKKEKLNKRQREVIRQEKQNEAVTKPKTFEAVSAELLSFITIREGMIILGCVKKINATSLEIALPGRINGIVEVSSISQTYLNLAEKYVQNESNEESTEDLNEYQPLAKVFEIGQIVCVKVKHLDTTNPKIIVVQLSMQPKDIQADFRHQSIRTDMIMSVAVAERQEHGYVIETGIANLRGFLPEVKSKKLIVGAVYMCRVESVMVNKSASTAVFNLYEGKKLLQFKEPDVNYILPGSIVKFNVKKILKDGLQGSILDDNLVGYVNEHQLGFAGKQPKEPKNFNAGDEVRARVLYIMPLTKIVYLTLNTYDRYLVEPHQSAAASKSLDIIPIGTVIEDATVTHIGTGGIILKLPNAKGVISLRSLKTKIGPNFDMETILSKYEKDSEHRVRVLHYDPIDFLHVCSVDKKIIDEKNFTINDVNTGDFVSVRIVRKLIDGRYEIKLGKIRGYIHPLYLSKTTPASKLQEKCLFKCRILCKNVPKVEIYVTNLKEFMDTKLPILTAETGSGVDSIFIGVVKKSLTHGWLIGFFDYLTGMIYRNNLTTTELSTAERFYEGQVLKVTIKHVSEENNKKHFVLGLADYLTDIGAVHSGKVTAIQSTGIDAAFLTGNSNGFVPIMYLSNFPSLVHALHRSYQCNDDIKAIGVAQNCYSIRDLTTISGEAMVIKRIADVKVGDVIPAFVKSVNGDIIDVYCLLKDFKTTISIHSQMFVEDHERVSDVSLVPDQKVYVKVCAVNKILKTITCSAKLHDVWPGSFRETALLYRQYFSDMDKIKKSLNATKSVRAYNIGQIVIAKPTNSDRTEDGDKPMRTFLLDDGVKVYVTNKNFNCGKKIEGNKILIVWIDYANNVLYGTMNKKFFDRMEIKQDEENAVKQLSANRGFKANVLLITDDLLVVYPTKLTNRFVFIPTRLHFNDFQPIITNGITEGAQINVSMIDVCGNRLIGMIHRLFDIYNSRIEQTVLVEEMKEEISEEKNEVSPPPKKKQKKSKASTDELNVSVSEIKEEEEQKEQQAVVIGEKKKGTPKKRKANANLSKSIVTDENDEEPEIKSPSKKKKTANASPKIVLKNKTPKKKAGKLAEDATPSKKKKQSVDTPKSKPTPKKTPKTKNDSKKQTPKKSPGKFSMKLSQLDGVLDLNDSDSDEDDSKTALPGVSNFWSTDLNVLNGSGTGKASSSESSSEDEDESSPKKKKLPTSKERFQAARNEEARIREIERSLADETVLPTSIDQFDRLVMAEPNNSRAWINYMVFHVQATEMDRARAIAQRALKTIDMREQQERLNIWVALLNMELRYGSKDAFDDTLKEALYVNEPFKVYSICLKIFADCKRIEDLNDMVLTVTKKFRQNPECWLNAAQAFLEVGLADKAKPLLTRALNSLPERDHISTISRFANLCNKHGEKDHAHALFEQIVVSYPKRVDCWSQYIDVLIKGNDIDLARQTLERAVTHKIPMKKMRTLFKKYLEFEQRFGNDESVTKVKMLAANYIHNEINS